MEVSNKTLVNGIKKQLGKAKGSWVEELSGLFWSYMETPRTNMKETPFSLAYDTKVMLPIELMIG